MGWWNSISAGDFDQDGDTDYIVGNLGQNNNYHITAQTPLKVFAKDFDGNGSIDPIMACYLKESVTSQGTKLFPMHFWDELNSQSPMFRRKFNHYRNYSKADISQLFTEVEMKDAVVLQANEMESSFLENKGNGQFALRRLDTRAQVAPVFGIVSGYFNDDSFLDFAMVGNDFGNEVFAGRYDAFTGLVMLGDGKSNFSISPSSKSGFYVPGNAKALATLNHPKGPLLIATQNRDSLKTFQLTTKTNVNVFSPAPSDASGTFVFKDGKKQRIEFYYGSGFLSQSTRSILIPPGVEEITVCDFNGNCRKVKP